MQIKMTGKVWWILTENQEKCITETSGKVAGIKRDMLIKHEKETEKTVEDILVKKLPNILGTVFMKFTEQDEEDTDNLKEGNRRGRSRSRNPDKDRKR